MIRILNSAWSTVCKGGLSKPIISTSARVQLADISRPLQARRKMSLHHLAKAGFTKGDFYHSYRVSYTPEAVSFITDKFKAVAGSSAASHYEVLELGAGTGKFTQVFLPALPQGTRYLATDPSQGFLDTLQQVLPGVETREVVASSIPLPDSSVKCVVCAQSFHWFSDLGTVKEIRRVLTSDGILVLIWNMYNTSVPWFGSVRAVMLDGDTDSPPARLDSGRWKDDIMAFPGFSEPLAVKLPGVENKGSMEYVIGQLQSSSLMSSLAEEKKAQMTDTILEIIRKEFGDDGSAVVQIPMTTEIYIFKSA